MKTVVIALLVAVVAALFYYPTLVRIPSTEEVAGSAPQQSATTAPVHMNSPAAPGATAPRSSAAPAGQVPTAKTQTPQPSQPTLPTKAAETTPPPPEVPPASGKKIIIVGGGLAGMSAAIEALRAGAHVHWLEKMPRLGGNSEKASSGMNAAKTAAQVKLRLKDSVEEFYQDTMASGQGLSNSALVHILTEQSASAYDFLTSFDVDLSAVTKLGGHKRARTHRPHQAEGVGRNVGWEITAALIKYIMQLPRDRFTITTGARLTSLIVEDGRVVGVEYQLTKRNERGQILHEEPGESRGDAVILATGGYARAPDLLAKYAPKIVDLATTNGPFAEGDGIKVAEKINASVIDMDQVQIHPTSFIAPDNPLMKNKILAPEALRGLGGILLNHEGKRFVNELDTRDKVSAAIFKNCKPMKVVQEVDGVKTEVEGPVMAYLVMIDEAVKEFPAFVFYSGKGFVTAYSQVEALAEGLKVPEKNLKETLAAYNECFIRQGNCRDPFGKKDFPYPTRDNDMFHVMMITPAIHYTMGGLEIDEQARVLKAIVPPTEEGHQTLAEETPQAREVIPGLYAAGEVTGGVHGANRLGGNSLLECVVFGRIAGRAAVAFTPSAAATSTPEPAEADVLQEASSSTPTTVL